jgi:antitoxin component of RelBE/YafQ-DinJ toxin-antitoxin module
LYTGDWLETEVLSVRVKKSLKDEAEKMGIDIKAAVEGLLEDLVAEKKAKAQKRAEDLRRAMGEVTVEEWIADVKETRREM